MGLGTVRVSRTPRRWRRCGLGIATTGVTIVTITLTGDALCILKTLLACAVYTHIAKMVLDLAVVVVTAERIIRRTAGKREEHSEHRTSYSRRES